MSPRYLLFLLLLLVVIPAGEGTVPIRGIGYPGIGSRHSGRDTDYNARLFAHYLERYAQNPPLC